MKINKSKYLDFKKKIILRQSIKTYYARNGAIYIFDNLKIKNNIFGNKVIPYFMDKKSSFDIDDFQDLEIVKKLIK